MSELNGLYIDGRWVYQNGSILEIIEHKGTLEGSHIVRKRRSAPDKNYPIIGQRIKISTSYKPKNHQEVKIVLTNPA